MNGIVISDESRITAGVLLLSVVAVESGGFYMLRIVRRQVAATGFQISFARAGHAHAGVPIAAILMPAGFFFSSAGAGRTEPNRFIWLVYAGATSLAIGVVTLGIGVLTGS